ncbi:peptidase domain-containing ABC transporter [Cellvibrio sp. PSBB023]|uniref:peptidase domain-containing ABC transporter n=1 Tax=Cellvibrio sp. PSBB023 TaxID=1945512 RepID=UPI00099021D0|nr:peptidase domain-containing ABC transporter [Cellvibrio sp. PSBB023]AQT61950.1 ABC transporter ATP-binding protein [Cellvibrio sp. PSBB023]
MTTDSQKIPEPENGFSSFESLNLLDFSRHQKLPIVLQSETAECGLACLAMISGFHGYSVDLASLRRTYPISAYGSNLAQLSDIAGRIGLASRAVRLEVEELSQLNLPCIIHWDINHFAVLKSVGSNHVVLHDPSYGRRKISLAEFSKRFTGVAFELIPTSEFEKKNEYKHLRISDLWSKISGLKRALIQIFIVSIFIECFTLVTPLYSQIIIDLIPNQNTNQLLYSIGAGFTFVLLTQILVSIFREFLLLRLTSQLSIQMAANLFYHLSRLPLSYFTKRHIGDLVSRFGSLTHIRQMITTGIISTLLDGIMALATLAVMLYYSINLTLLVLGVVALYVGLRIFFYEPFKQLNHEKLIADANENSHFMETLRAVQTIKLFQQENNRQQHWLNRLATAINKQIKITRWGIAFSSAQHLLFGLENILIVLLAAFLVMDGSFTLGMLFAFMSFKVSFVSAVNNLIDQLVNFKMLDIHLERISDIVFTKKENINEHTSRPDDSITLPPLEGKITVNDLTYRFDGAEEDAFSSVSFEIHPGESVAIVGPSGCGKTTLLKCLMGLLEPTSGEILVDGKPLKKIKHYRSQIAGVMQDDQLVSGSLKDNITLFEAESNWNKIYEATSKACIHDEILKLPMDYQTLVGDMGSSLSGGQKQRIVLARALYRQPRILFLDEATSHLDIQNESLVNKYVKQLAITRVIVAHRPETIESADRSIYIGKT